MWYRSVSNVTRGGQRTDTSGGRITENYILLKVILQHCKWHKDKRPVGHYSYVSNCTSHTNPIIEQLYMCALSCISLMQRHFDSAIIILMENSTAWLLRNECNGIIKSYERHTTKIVCYACQRYFFSALINHLQVFDNLPNIWRILCASANQIFSKSFDAIAMRLTFWNIRPNCST